MPVLLFSPLPSTAETGLGQNTQGADPSIGAGQRERGDGGAVPLPEGQLCWGEGRALWAEQAFHSKNVVPA